VRDYLQGQVKGAVDDYWPRVIVSYATGTRDKSHGYKSDLDGDGCGLGMQYLNLVVRHLERAGIPSFSGLHVAGGNNWVSVASRLEGEISRSD